jgi:hypothetical protein
MRVQKHVMGVLAGWAALCAATAQADMAPETMKFAVMRGDTQIGTNTIDIGRNGGETNVRIVTHIEVGMAFLTLYKYDQTETEQWANGHLLAMNSLTNDNGRLHRVIASNRQGKMVVEGDGRLHMADAAIFPISLWNPPFPDKSVGLNPQDGSIVPIAVTDKGVADIAVEGRSQRAHHFAIKSTFSQDVWYDGQGRLIRVEMHGSDGSTIHYEPL